MAVVHVGTGGDRRALISYSTWNRASICSAEHGLTETSDAAIGTHPCPVSCATARSVFAVSAALRTNKIEHGFARRRILV